MTGKWKYCEYSFAYYTDMEKELSKYGALGWELVSVTYDTACSSYHAFSKYKIEN